MRRLGPYWAGLVLILAGLIPPATASTSNATLVSSTTSLEARATQIAARLQSEAAKLHLVAVQAAKARSKEKVLSQQVGSEKVKLVTLRSELSGEVRSVRRMAINAFVTDGAADQLSILVTSNVEQLGLRREYLDIAVGRLQLAMDRLKRLRSQDKQEEAILSQELSKERAEAARLSSDEAALSSSASQLENELSSLHGQIAQQVAAAEAAQAAAQARAAALAREKAAQAAARAAERAAQQAAERAAQRAAQQAAEQAAQAQKAAQQAQQGSQAPPAQGNPTPSGVGSIAQGAAGTSSWGGVPAPPTPAAFAALAQCESSGNFADNTGNGYYGGYQFAESTWLSLGMTGYPYQFPASVQTAAARKLQAEDGWAPWPACSAMLGFD